MDVPDEEREFRQMLRRISVKLSTTADRLPGEIYVEGVELLDPYNANGGAFADIYKGIYNGQEVAVKKPRFIFYRPIDERNKAVKVSSSSYLVQLSTV